MIPSLHLRPQKLYACFELVRLRNGGWIVTFQFSVQMLEVSNSINLRIIVPSNPLVAYKINNSDYVFLTISVHPECALRP